MIEGKVAGYFLVGENPTVGHANGRMQRFGLANLEWLVVRDLQMIESATFWKDGPEIATGELVTEQIADRDLLHAGRHARGEGRHLHPDPAAAAVAAQGASSRPATPRATCGSTSTSAACCAGSWPGPPIRATARCSTSPGTTRCTATTRSPAPRRCCARSTASVPTAGRCPATWSSRTTARRRAAAGSTAASTPTRSTRPPAASPAGSRRGRARVGLGVAATTGGSSTTAPRPTPTASRGASARSTCGGTRTPAAGSVTTSPTSRRPSGRTTCRRTDAKAQDATRRDDPFVMQSDGKAWLFAPKGVQDGPLPTHYEPAESPVANALYSAAVEPDQGGDPRALEPGQPVACPTSSRSRSPPTGSPSTTRPGR